MTAAEEFYLDLVALLLGVVLVMLVLVCAFRIFWAVVELRRDLDARARRDAATEADAADDAVFAWSAAAWAEFDLIGRGRS